MTRKEPDYGSADAPGMDISLERNYRDGCVWVQLPGAPRRCIEPSKAREMADEMEQKFDLDELEEQGYAGHALADDLREFADDVEGAAPTARIPPVFREGHLAVVEYDPRRGTRKQDIRGVITAADDGVLRLDESADDRNNPRDVPREVRIDVESGEVTSETEKRETPLGDLREIYYHGPAEMPEGERHSACVLAAFHGAVESIGPFVWYDASYFGEYEDEVRVGDDDE